MLDAKKVLDSALPAIRVRLGLGPDDLLPKLEVKVSGDEAKIMRGVGMTRMCMQVRAAMGDKYSNAPVDVRTFFLIEGPDKHANYAEIMTVSMNQLTAGPGRKCPPRHPQHSYPRFLS